MAGKQVTQSIHHLSPCLAGFTTVRSAAVSLAGGQLLRSTGGCSVDRRLGNLIELQSQSPVGTSRIFLHNRFTLTRLCRSVRLQSCDQCLPQDQSNIMLLYYSLVLLLQNTNENFGSIVPVSATISICFVRVEHRRIILCNPSKSVTSIISVMWW